MELTWKGDFCFDIHETIETYVPPGGLYACPLQKVSWDEMWPIHKVWSWGEEDYYGFPGYSVYSGYLVDKTIGYKPSGASITFESNPPLSKLKRWREIVDLRDDDHPNRPIVGDRIARSDDWWGGLYNTSHADDLIPSMDGVSANMLYPDGSAVLYRSGYELWTENTKTGKSWRYWVPR